MKNDRIIVILSVLCALSVVLMIVSLCGHENDNAGFVAPPFDETAKQGMPHNEESARFGWAEISQDEIPYKTAVCGKLQIVDKQAVVFLTNYADNDVWLKLRVLDGDGKTIAETGLAKPGEYIESVQFTEAMKDGEVIKLKIMAYEPETYYSVGSIVLNTTIKTGE